LTSRRISEATGWVGLLIPGTLTGRSPVSSAVRTALLRQKAKELVR